MNRENLKLFLDVRDTGNITRAANANYISQSSASKRIALLERELGVKLFRRGKGKDTAEITQAGEDFADIAERMLFLYQQAVGLKNNAGRKVLVIACINSIQGYSLPPFIRKLQETYPNLCITLEDHHSLEIFPMIANRRIDIGIAQIATPFSELRSELLIEEDYRVVMLPGEKARNIPKEVHPSELLAEHEIFEAFDMDFQKWHDYWWRPSASKIRVNTTPTAERYFNDQEDWMIVPATVAYAMEQKNFISHPLKENPPKHRVYVTHNKKVNNEMVHIFTEELKKYYHEYAESLREKGLL